MRDYLPLLLVYCMVLSPTAPSTPPSGVEVTDMTSSTITVQWGEVPCIHQNGAITGYSVQYGVNGSGNTQTITVDGATVMEATIPSLNPSTTYTVQVAAVNSVDTRVFSDSQSAMTLGITEESMLNGCTVVFLISLPSCCSSSDSRVHSSHLHLPLLDQWWHRGSHV